MGFLLSRLAKMRTFILNFFLICNDLIYNLHATYICMKATSYSSLRKLEENEMSKATLAKIPLIRWHKCDICGIESHVVYITQLDSWYCIDCFEIGYKLEQLIRGALKVRAPTQGTR
jgi:hypothetical protein